MACVPAPATFPLTGLNFRARDILMSKLFSKMLIVQKYGGTSVGNVDRIKNVAAKIKSYWSEGHQVVVVVSARSGVTNELIARAKSISATPSEREMDMLLATGEQETIALTALALHAIGVPAVSRTGAQAGIITDTLHSRAHIAKLTGGDIKARLDEGKVVIVAGFQGISSKSEIQRSGAAGATSPQSRSRRRSKRTFARFSRTWTAFTPRIRASSSTRKN